MPTKPVTANDYRKLFIDINGIKNAWLRPYKKQVFFNCKDETLSYTPFEIEEKYKKDFTLQGLYEVLLDFDDLDPAVYNTFLKIATRKKQLENEVRKIYHLNRNLCEDLMVATEVETHPISVCAIIDVKPEADEELVHARVLRAINSYFSPSVRFYSLQEMFAKGYSSTEIFDGPILKNGFIDPAELAKADLRKEIRLTDIVQLIMDIDGVRLIKEISINNCGDENKPEGQPWIICIDDGKKPMLCSKSAFSYTKGRFAGQHQSGTCKKIQFPTRNRGNRSTKAGTDRQVDRLAYRTIPEDWPICQHTEQLSGNLRNRRIWAFTIGHRRAKSTSQTITGLFAVFSTRFWPVISHNSIGLRNCFRSTTPPPAVISRKPSATSKELRRLFRSNT